MKQLISDETMLYSGHGPMTTLEEEKRTNPFFRGDVSSEIRKNVGATESEGFDTVFGKIRKAKDMFRG
jgi:hypothetical protein